MKRFKNILFVADRQDGLTAALDRAGVMPVRWNQSAPRKMVSHSKLPLPARETQDPSRS